MERDITILPPWNSMDIRLFDGVTTKRVFAYAVDVILVSVLVVVVWVALGLAGLLTFGLLLPLQALAVALTPLLYHTLMIGGPQSATLGMRLMGVKVVQDSDGQPPTLGQACILTIAFYGSIALTASLILLLALFNVKRRTLHDFLAGTVVINRETGL